MSIEHMQRVWKHSETKGATRLALLAIADKCDELGYCWPGIPHIANMIRMSTRQTQRLIQEAASAGELLVDRSEGGRRTNFYVVIVGADDREIYQACTQKLGYTKAQANATIETIHQIRKDQQGPGGDKMSPPPVTSCHPSRDKDVTPAVTRMSPDPSLTIKTQEEEEKDQTFWTSPRQPLTRKAGRQYAAETGTTDPSAILVAHIQKLIDQPKGLIKKYKEAAGVIALGESDRATITAWIDHYQAKVDAHEMDRNLASRLAYAAIRDGNPAPVVPEPVTVASISQAQPINAWASFMAAD